MKKVIRIIVILICILFCNKINISYANISENFSFKNLTVEDGLSQSTVNTIFQDSKGYMWIGTQDGLNRYDGYEFKHYKAEKFDKNTIANNIILDITEDKHGNIWVATLEGVSRINVVTDEIKNYYTHEYNNETFDISLCKIIYTKNDQLIISTPVGLNIYNEKEDRFISRDLNEKNIRIRYIYDIEADSNGNIWIGTDNGLYELDKNLNQLQTYQDTIGECDIYDIYDDLKGNIWVCTLGDGLFKVSNNKVDSFKSTGKPYSLPSNTVKAALTDSKGRLWIGTDNGICTFNYDTQKFVTTKTETGTINSLINNQIMCLFEDRSERIWIGTNNGISIFTPNEFSHYKLTHTKDRTLDFIIGIYEDEDTTLWIGSDGHGVSAVHKDEVKPITKENGGLVSNFIEDITGSDNKIFIGTSEGLSILTKHDKSGAKYTINNYTTEEGLPSNQIRSLFIDSKGFLWIGFRNGLAVLNTATNEIIDLTYILDELGIKEKFIRTIYEDSKGNYYIGCFLNEGLIKINPKNKTSKLYKNIENDKTSITDNTIRYINEDLNGNILVGTDYGLNVLNTKTNKFTRYTERDGLINNTIYGVLVDDDNNVWMSTNRGISKVSLKDKSVKNFTSADGLQSNEFNRMSCFKDKDGNMYFGGINGFNVFNPKDIELSNFKPTVTLETLSVNGVEREYKPNMKLYYSENNIKVKFFTDDFKNARNTQFYYKLEGASDNWDVTDTNTITLANLASGNYTLKVKTKTQHGILSDDLVMEFKVKPPILLSHWAMIVYIILILLFIYMHKLRFKKLDRLVNERTIDLIYEMEKNEKLFNKILTLEKNKNNYFVNLSHELRTPLNVLNSINQLLKDFAQKEKVLSGEKLGHYSDMIDRNCSRLLNLINNLIDNTRLDNNNYILDKKDIDIVYLVEETIFDMKEYIEENGLEFVFDTDIEEKYINCGKFEIERCIINLVSNSVKFTPEGGLIEVNIEDLDSKVKISVKDNGVGISEENQKLIFDRFNQVVDEYSEQKGGSGLGLTITKQLITLHGGEIYVKSKVGVGSEFIIILPVEDKQ